MSIERRVKPAPRTAEEKAQKAKTIAVVAGGLAVFAVVAFVAISMIGGEGSTVIPGMNADGGVPNAITQDMAVRAIAESAVSYRGTWYDDADKGFQCYLPGGTEVSGKEFESVMVRTNEGSTAVYGIAISDDRMATLDGDPAEDPMTVVNSVLSKAINDASSVMYGADFSEAVDISSVALSDGTKALWIKGTLQTVASVRSEGSDSAQDTTIDFTIQGFVSLRDGWPVFVWAVADPSDSASVANLGTIMHECAKVFSNITE